MEDSNAKAAVHAASIKWQWYMFRNPFYNATVSPSLLWQLVLRLHSAYSAAGWKVGFCSS
jgi:hypothetical protein